MISTAGLDRHAALSILRGLSCSVMAGIPTLSQINGWDVEHLTAAADHWSGAADRWESAFTDAWQQAHTVEWEGFGATAMRDRATADKTAVTQKADLLREAATVARRGASDISAAQRRVLYAIEDAHNAGFHVGEDLSVTDTRSSRSAAEQAARQAQAQTLAADIRSRATELSALDNEVSTNITTAAGDVGTPAFAQQGHVQAVDNTWQNDPGPVPPPANSLGPIDPRNPFVGDERFGHWENVVPPPYVGKDPPPPWTGHRSLEGLPGKDPAGPSGFYVPGGKTWADDNAPPLAYLQEQYRFRMSGEDYTAYTRTVNGQQQQWVQYTYDAQRYTQVSFGGSAWAPKGPNEITNEPGGVVSGGLAGINPPPKIYPWQPITLPQMGMLSAENPNVTYYVPNGCDGQFTFTGGVPTGGTQPPPRPPSMIAAP
jgi:hypothetical protein